MDLLIAFLLFAAAMVASLLWGAEYAMLLALLVGLACFYAVARGRGFARGDLLRMMVKSVGRSMIVVRIFVLIGLLTALWRSSGTITFFVVQGVRLIPPALFLAAGFGLTCLLGYALGTSFGVTGTVGVILMTLARSGGVPPALMAGAVLSGAYFGDRTGPASSCANLVATVTGTDLYGNLRRMMKTALLPLALCFLLYGLLSPRYPLTAGEGGLLGAMAGEFTLTLWCVIPAILMLVLPLCKVPVRRAMGLSILSAFALSVFVQGMGVGETLSACVLGFTPKNGELTAILAGGGLLSMLKVSGIILLSGTYSGIFEGTRMLEGLQERLAKLAEKWSCFGLMLPVSAAVTAVFCNQTIGVMMVQQLLEPVYAKEGQSKEDLALDIADSLVVLVGLCPWCIACAVPLEMLGVGVEALPWAAFLYLLPLCHLMTARRKKPEIV